MLTDDCNSMIKSRSSIRKFKSAAIPDNDINEIIEIGSRAPSAGNCQPWRVVVVKDPATREKSLLLGAHFKGYGACWVGAFDEETVTMILNVPAEMRPVALIPIGIPDGPVPKKRKRRPLSEILVKEGFVK
jgi:nitroreductase